MKMTKRIRSRQTLFESKRNPLKMLNGLNKMQRWMQINREYIIGSLLLRCLRT